MYKNILVAVDHNQYTEKIVINAIETALAFGSKLTVCHIRRNGVLYSPIDPTGLLTPSNLFMQEFSYPMDEELERIKQKAERAGIHEVEIVQTFSSSPGLAISQVIAPGYETDLIIIGASHKSSLDHFLLGSISKQIIKHSPVDVKLVRK